MILNTKWQIFKWLEKSVKNIKYKRNIKKIQILLKYDRNIGNNVYIVYIGYLLHMKTLVHFAILLNSS